MMNRPAQPHNYGFSADKICDNSSCS